MEKPRSGRTYKQLGKQLKELRSRASETLAEASGAVEIDVRELARYELGQARPSEEILLLLISHFGARDEEAIRLWELAGYGLEKIPVAHLGNNETLATESNPNNDKRILFTDVVDVVVNNYGVVMNFLQNNGPGGQPTSVARVGMSREHAKSVLQILQVTLAQTDQIVAKMPKRLTKPDHQNPEK